MEGGGHFHRLLLRPGKHHIFRGEDLSVPVGQLAAIGGNAHLLHPLQLGEGEGDAVVGHGQLNAHQVPIGPGQVHGHPLSVLLPLLQIGALGEGRDQLAVLPWPLQQGLHEGGHRLFPGVRNGLQGGGGVVPLVQIGGVPQAEAALALVATAPH